MQSILSLALTLSLGLCTLLAGVVSDSHLRPVSASQVEEKVFSADEVEKQAEMKNFDAASNKFNARFKCEREGTTVISFVLRKSGKVSDVKVENSAGCKASEKALAELRKIKFTPAMKDGVAVSQLIELEIKAMLVPVPGP
jgi:TonB family C-terminal domain